MSLVMFPGVAKLGNICNRNNVSATMFHSLARPFRLKDHLLSFSGHPWPKNIPGYAISCENLSLNTLSGLLPEE